MARRSSGGSARGAPARDAAAEVDRFLEAHPGTRHLDVLMIDLCGKAVGKRYPAAEMRSVYGQGAPLCAAMTLLDEFGDVLRAMEANAKAQRLPVTTLLSEYGAGQFEINLQHADDPVRAADHAALLRRAVVETARAHGFDATFLSKPYLAHSGSGLHIHLSLVDGDGRNVFDPAVAGADERLGHTPSPGCRRPWPRRWRCSRRTSTCTGASARTSSPR